MSNRVGGREGPAGSVFPVPQDCGPRDRVFMSDRQPASSETRNSTDRSVGEASPWLVSLLLHFAFLIAISILSIQVQKHVPALVLVSPLPDEATLEQVVPEEFHFDPTPREDIGATSLGGIDDRQVAAQLVMPDSPQIPSLELEPQPTGQLEAREFIEVTTGPQASLNQAIKGTAGVGVAGADGAIDRITQEILLSLEEQPTLVVWFFDRSGSLQMQRAEINQRFHRVYDELGVIEASGDAAFVRHADKPLLTSVVSFGSRVDFPVDQPTDDLPMIQEAVAEIEPDDSGVERVFTAFQEAAQRYRKYRTTLHRNVMFVAFTDEAGDDQEGLDSTVAICRRLAIPVYIVGVPAPFGRRETLVKWVDPDPTYDQSPQWGRVDQGPESLLTERIKLQLSGFREDEAPIDSGFGPFALTRLCYETGGIYFTVHPNRQLERRVSRRETNAYTAYFAAFFDPDVMRRYRPEYVSAQEYSERVRKRPLRAAAAAGGRILLVAAARDAPTAVCRTKRSDSGQRTDRSPESGRPSGAVRCSSWLKF